MTRVTRMTGAQASKFKFEFGSTCLPDVNF